MERKDLNKKTGWQVASVNLLVVALILIIALAGDAQAWGRGISTSTQHANNTPMSHKSYVNIYEERKIAYIEAQEAYELRYAKWENRVELLKKKSEIQREKKKEIEQRKRIRELKAEQRRMAKIQVAKRSTSSSFLPELSNSDSQGISSAQSATGVEQSRPRRPTMFQRLKYAFTGSYE